MQDSSHGSEGDSCATAYKQHNVFFLVGLNEHFWHAVIACVLIEEEGKDGSKEIKSKKLFTALCVF